MSSSVIETMRAEPIGAATPLVLSDTVAPVATRPGALTLDHRLAIRRQLRELAELAEERVERVATVGVEPVAAYDIGLRDAVRDGLAKLASGTFGSCETCHRQIPAARLEAVPYARRCVACQRRWEAGWDQVEGLVGSVVRTLVGEPQGPASGGERPQHVGQDPTVAVVIELHGGVDPHIDAELSSIGPDRDR